jgi:hypothetical protein
MTHDLALRRLVAEEAAAEPVDSTFDGIERPVRPSAGVTQRTGL